MRAKSYLGTQQEAVSIKAEFAELPDGTNHVSTSQIDGASKHLTVKLTDWSLRVSVAFPRHFRSPLNDLLTPVSSDRDCSLGLSCAVEDIVMPGCGLHKRSEPRTRRSQLPHAGGVKTIASLRSRVTLCTAPTSWAVCQWIGILLAVLLIRSTLPPLARKSFAPTNLGTGGP